MEDDRVDESHPSLRRWLNARSLPATAAKLDHEILHLHGMGDSVQSLFPAVVVARGVLLTAACALPISDDEGVGSRELSERVNYPLQTCAVRQLRVSFSLHSYYYISIILFIISLIQKSMIASNAI